MVWYGMVIMTSAINRPGLRLHSCNGRVIDGKLAQMHENNE